MSNRQSDKNLLQKWIVANTAGFIIGGTFFILFNHYINFANNVYKPDEIYFYFASLAIPSILTGIFQWLVIKTKIPRISIWWTLTNIPGLYVGLNITWITFVLALIIHKLPIVTNFHETASKLLGYNVYYFLYDTITVSLLGLLGGAAGGLLTGITQVLLLKKQIHLLSWKKWILTITLSWAISWWSLVGAIFLIPSLSSFIRKISDGYICNFNCIFIIKIIQILLWTGFGLLFGFLNGAISGRVLVWLLRQSRQSQLEN